MTCKVKLGREQPGMTCKKNLEINLLYYQGFDEAELRYPNIEKVASATPGYKLIYSVFGESLGNWDANHIGWTHSLSRRALKRQECS